MTTLINSSPMYNRSLSNRQTGGGQSTFTWREGRRYHNDKDAVYPLPCDLRELDRMNLTHYLFHHIFNKHFAAPFHDQETAPKKVLDVGCGTGVWILETDKAFKHMAYGCHDVEFVGIDLVDIQMAMPPGVNVKFLHCNVLSIGLPFPDETFDYVNLHFTGLCYNESNHHILLDEIFRVLKPGGIYELVCSIAYNDITTNLKANNRLVEGVTATKEICNVTVGAAQTKEPTYPFVEKLNRWVTAGLGTKLITVNPCSVVHLLFSGYRDQIEEYHGKRLLVPLDCSQYGLGRHTLATICVTEAETLIESVKADLKDHPDFDNDEFTKWKYSIPDQIPKIVGENICYEIGAWWMRKKL